MANTQPLWNGAICQFVGYAVRPGDLSPVRLKHAVPELIPGSKPKPTLALELVKLGFKALSKRDFLGGHSSEFINGFGQWPSTARLPFKRHHSGLFEDLPTLLFVPGLFRLGAELMFFAE
jgi:hypothetical protein